MQIHCKVLPMTSNDQLGIEFLRTPVLLLNFFIFIHSQDFLFSVYLDFVLFYNSQKCEIYKVIKILISFHGLGRFGFNTIVKLSRVHIGRRIVSIISHFCIIMRANDEWRWVCLTNDDSDSFLEFSARRSAERQMIKSCLIHPLDTDTLKFSQSD